MARRLLALFVMLPLSALVMLAWLLECFGLFRWSEPLGDWTDLQIVRVITWVERGRRRPAQRRQDA